MKTNFKPIIFAVILLATVASCKPDKKAELTKLKKQQQELVDKIATLEAELKDSTAKGDIIVVSAEAIALQPFAHAIEVQGALDGEENVKVFPQGSGVITQVLVGVGSKVSKGQVIAKIDDQMMRSSLASTQSQYKLAADMYERQKNLWNQKIGSEVQFLQAKTNKEQLENTLAALKEQLSYLQIKSPINGSVEDLPLKVGMSVGPQAPVATVINFSSIKVVADVAEAYNTSISTGDAVTLWFPDLQKEVQSKISSASKYITPSNRSFKVEVRIPGNEKNLKANMIAVLRITDYKNPKAVVVKINFVQNDAKGSYVYVVATDAKGKNIAQKRYITQGMTYNGMVEVKEGLVAGDQIITAGQMSLTDGVEVKL
ncbi:MAG: efflux RND transporter periplasmic adaptor subunit [Bacteroidales bacterium]|nr:efflux RND transporter periplasmic adaptor subunit [Bacteroidales bacterium]